MKSSSILGTIYQNHLDGIPFPSHPKFSNYKAKVHKAVSNMIRPIQRLSAVYGLVGILGGSKRVRTLPIGCFALNVPPGAKATPFQSLVH